MATGIYGIDFDARRGEHDAGSGFSYSLWYLDEEHTQPGGICEWHPCPVRDDRPEGAGNFAILPFDVPGTEQWKVHWHLEQLLPLTISPSILCRECGFHGFLRAGRWESC